MRNKHDALVSAANSFVHQYFGRHARSHLVAEHHVEVLWTHPHSGTLHRIKVWSESYEGTSRLLWSYMDDDGSFGRTRDNKDDPVVLVKWNEGSDKEPKVSVFLSLAAQLDA
jgi:hypothetical protein